mgnify:CR=1 FL=1
MLSQRCTLLAPTGKAAGRIREAAGLLATTVHSWLYQPVETPEGVVVFHRRDLDKLQRADLIIVDEASMVGPDMMGDLVVACTAIRAGLLLVGDDFQLPPVQKPGAPEYCALLDMRVNRAVRLTEVMRQALDSPVLRAATLIREGQVRAGLKVLPTLHRETLDVVREGGAVIAHTNATRHTINLRLRRALGIEGEVPQPSEPLLIMQNDARTGYFNGEVVRFKRWLVQPSEYVWKSERVGAKWRTFNPPKVAHFGVAEVEGASGIVHRTILCAEELLGEQPELTPRAYYGGAGGWLRDTVAKAAKAGVPLLNNLTLSGQRPPLLRANLGYCLTAHKAQGSEWKRVIVMVEKSVRPDKRDGQRWLYTAITRAREQTFITYL